MNNYKLEIQYDGTNYAGWQIQKNAVSIQQKITDAVSLILKEKINLIGSGRTDAGVHALGQVANFRTEKVIDIYSFKHSLNGILPVDISVTKMESVNENFHSRFDANRRIYFYLISKIKSPFMLKYSYYLHQPIDSSSLNLLSTALIGTHDFTGLSRKNPSLENKTCTLYSAHWKEIKSMIVFRIEADRFLHGMVRIIVATLLNAQKQNLDKESIIKILQGKGNLLGSGAAPAKGLFLYKVLYD